MSIDLTRRGDAANLRERPPANAGTVLERALAVLPEATLVADSEGRVLAVNDRFCRLVGRARETMVGAAPPLDFLPGLLARDLVSLAVFCAAGGEEGFEVDLRRGDGRRAAVVARVGVMRDGEGGTEAVLLTLTDVGVIRTREDTERALRHVAMSVARGDGAAEVLSVVAHQVARLFDCDAGLVCRFEPPDEAVVVGAWGVSPSEFEGRLPTDGPGALAQVRATGAAGRVDAYESLPQGTAIRRALFDRGGFRSAVAASVELAGRRWGAVVALSRVAVPFPSDAEPRLARFAEIVALAIAGAEARAQMEIRASRDYATGLLNHRSFREGLDRLAGVRGWNAPPVSLAVFDIDHFKRVNDELGHAVGDEVLRAVAMRLERHVSAGDLLARVGGEEFAWLMPGRSAGEVSSRVEVARTSVAELFHPKAGRVTLSAGICDSRWAEDPDTLVRYAEGAVYWAKRQGRDGLVCYRPEVVPVLSDRERAEDLARRQALSGIRVLARAVDQKDPSTRRHSERVADTAAAIAGALGWSREARARLHEAGLVHDVGKIGVPDVVLFKPSRLTDEEYAVVREHAAFGARMLEEVLDAEQVAWVRGHHERWDGRGYPDGLAGEDVPEGARIMAMADAWDVMTSARAYHAPLTGPDALAECAAHAGSQFWPAAVEALVGLVTEGMLRAA